MITNAFPTSAAQKTYKQCVFIEKEKNDYGVTESFDKILQNKEFFNDNWHSVIFINSVFYKGFHDY